MKSGQFSRLWGRQFSFIASALVFTTILFWSCENNPLFVGILSTPERFTTHRPDLFVDDAVDSSILLNTKEQLDDAVDSSVPLNTKEQLYDAVDSSIPLTTKEEMDDAVDSSIPLTTKEEVDDAVDSSIPLNTKEQLTEEDSRSHEEGGLEYNKRVESSDSSVKDSESVLSSELKHENTILASSTEKQDCNYAKGRWIADSRRPLYSGFGCKQWLSDMWACRLTQRTDFSYEGYRWQPDNCEFREFEGAEFLRRMQDQTIAFIGDSLGRQQFQSLMCMATGGEERLEVEDVGWKFGLVKPRRAIRPDGWAYRFPHTNTTILYYWSASLCGIEPINATDPATEYAMHLDRPPGFLRRFLDQFHVVILNTGHHWNRGKFRANRWVMYANGQPVTDRKLVQMGNAKDHAIYSIARWCDSQISLRPQLRVFFRTISPRHFMNGDWNTGGNCDNLTPLTKGSEVVQERSSDPVIEDAVKGTKVTLLDVTALSQLRDECHISRFSRKSSVGINDCLHWCLPGIPDTWNELLYAQL